MATPTGEEIYYCPECGWFSAPNGFTGKCPHCHGLIKAMRCSRCMHAWWPKRSSPPRVCPHCKSPYWNRRRNRSRNDKDNYKGGDSNGN